MNKKQKETDDFIEDSLEIFKYIKNEIKSAERHPALTAAFIRLIKPKVEAFLKKWRHFDA